MRVYSMCLSHLVFFLGVSAFVPGCSQARTQRQSLQAGERDSRSLLICYRISSPPIFAVSQKRLKTVVDRQFTQKSLADFWTKDCPYFVDHCLEVGIEYGRRLHWLFGLPAFIKMATLLLCSAFDRDGCNARTGGATFPGPKILD